jgi:hypothetical protein
VSFVCPDLTSRSSAPGLCTTQPVEVPWLISPLVPQSPTWGGSHLTRPKPAVCPPGLALPSYPADHIATPALLSWRCFFSTPGSPLSIPHRPRYYCATRRDLARSTRSINKPGFASSVASQLHVCGSTENCLYAFFVDLAKHCHLACSISLFSAKESLPEATTASLLLSVRQLYGTRRARVLAVRFAFALSKQLRRHSF